MIGDPGGESSGRSSSTETVARDADGIRPQLERFLDFEASANAGASCSTTPTGSARCRRRLPARRRQALHVNYMMARSRSARLESEDGISYTEFSYMLLQAYDFLELFDDATAAGCRWAAATSGGTSRPGSS